MKQVFQDLRSGETMLMDVPAPGAAAGTLLIRTRASLISAGTERMLLEFSKAGFLDKARQQPDKVRMVLEKIRTEGLLSAIEAVSAKLQQPVPLGYCNCGEVLEVGSGVSGYSVGDRVLSNGPHAEVCRVPVNLCARVPQGVSDEQATFTVLGAVALQGLRLAAPTLGETFVVIGLGLVGLLAVQLLRANGCRVIGVDPNPARLELARALGALSVPSDDSGDVVAGCHAATAGRDVDGVIVAAATASKEPISQAARMCRKRGRIVLVGTAGLELSRADFYEKELTFQVSCSYGPGRYDPGYEQNGQDYPIGYVRWTEQRNFEAVLELMATGALQVDALVSHRFALHQAAHAYEALASDRAALGIVLSYDGTDRAVLERTVVASGSATASASSAPRAAFLGAGNYAARVLAPAFRAAGFTLRSIATRGSPSAALVARKQGFELATSDLETVYADSSVDVVVIATRHDSHASLASRALRAGKHVFLEKPLAISRGQLDALCEAWSATRKLDLPPRLTAGFNRRFSPHLKRVRELLAARREPKSILYTINAGAIPPDHWVQDPLAGGGRLIGEACHFIDACRFLVGAPIVRAQAEALVESTRTPTFDTAAINLRFADGSIASIAYFANGARAFPKERIEIFCNGATLQVDNFLRTRGFGWPGFRGLRTWRPDKGQQALVAAWKRCLTEGGNDPIAVEELFETARFAISCAEQVDPRIAVGGDSI